MDIHEAIEKLEKERFYLSMKDHWTAEDFRRNSELKEEIRQLKEMVDEDE